MLLIELGKWNQVCPICLFARSIIKDNGVIGHFQNCIDVDTDDFDFRGLSLRIERRERVLDSPHPITCLLAQLELMRALQPHLFLDATCNLRDLAKERTLLFLFGRCGLLGVSFPIFVIRDVAIISTAPAAASSAR